MLILLIDDAPLELHWRQLGGSLELRETCASAQKAGSFGDVI